MADDDCSAKAKQKVTVETVIDRNSFYSISLECILACCRSSAERITTKLERLCWCLETFCSPEPEPSFPISFLQSYSTISSSPSPLPFPSLGSLFLR